MTSSPGSNPGHIAGRQVLSPLCHQNSEFRFFFFATESEEDAPPSKLNLDDDFFVDSSPTTGNKAKFSNISLSMTALRYSRLFL